MHPSGRRATLFILSCFALFAFQWYPIRDLVRYALGDSTNASQVLLIPFVSAALIFWDRRRIFAGVQYSVTPGVLIAIVGMLLMAASHLWFAPDLDQYLRAKAEYEQARASHPSEAHPDVQRAKLRMDRAQENEGDRLALRTASIMVVGLGLFVAFFGVEAFRAAQFPLLFLLFCIPIPSPVLNQLISFLQRWSAEISLALLRLSGTPVFREGFVFHMPRLSIEVAPECSGIRSCLSMLILTVLGGHLLLTTTWRRLALVVVAIPIMIFKNAIRIVTLTLLSLHVDPGIIESRLHREGGIPFFLVALLLTYPILKILMRTEKAESKNSGGQTTLREANL